MTKFLHCPSDKNFVGVRSQDNTTYCTGDYYFASDLFGGDLFAIAFCAAWLRGMKQGIPPRFNEFRGGRIQNVPLPGEIRYHALAALAAGADHLCFFRWDTFPSGNERNNYGIVRSLKYPGRSFLEIKKLMEELLPWRDFLNGSKPRPARTGILYSFETHCDTAEIKPEYPGMNEPFGNGYAHALSLHFRALMEVGEHPDILFQNSDFSRYSVIILANMLVLTDVTAQKLRDFVRDGGILLMFPGSCVYDKNGQMFTNGIPGPLEDVFGAVCEDYGKISLDSGLRVYIEGTSPISAGEWVDEILPYPDTRVVGRYSAPLDSIPAYTCHRYEKGKAFYLGIYPESRKVLPVFYREFYRKNNLELDYTPSSGEFRLSRYKEGERLDFIFYPVTHDVKIEYLADGGIKSSVKIK